ncbi:hypothetical protein [Brachyspira pilosicoli]|nr:hypothetical protein [Brachyspira pilosicoli]AAQ67242.1 outer membrane lipoprotein [Brachyspira pilosicoli]AAQ67244.1 outer membrane lipoprotein [Brachyspira pilosicoli]AAQ83614.1 BmpC [Brachyspira pilosicoli]ABS50213.1 BmpC [Brachyspira pilosicoli]
MNKKILSIFVMVMALSLLSISCNNKKTTGTGDIGGGTTENTGTTEDTGNKEPEETRTILKASDLEAWLKNIPETSPVNNAIFTFSSGNFSGDTLSVESTGASSKVSADNVKTEVLNSLKSLDKSKFKIKTTIGRSIFTGGNASGNSPLVATFEIEPANDSYVFDSNVEAIKSKIKLSLTVNDNYIWQ